MCIRDRDIGILKPDALDPRSGLVVLHQRFKFRNLILGQLPQEHHVAAVNSVIVGGAELRLIQTEILNQSLKGRLHAVLVRVLLVRVLGAVSYTHLDVYKRQNFTCPFQELVL